MLNKPLLKGIFFIAVIYATALLGTLVIMGPTLILLWLRPNLFRWVNDRLIVWWLVLPTVRAFDILRLHILLFSFSLRKLSQPDSLLFVCFLNDDYLYFCHKIVMALFSFMGICRWLHVESRRLCQVSKLILPCETDKLYLHRLCLSVNFLLNTTDYVVECALYCIFAMHQRV